jgi:hypothetical protein
MGDFLILSKRVQYGHTNNSWQTEIMFYTQDLMDSVRHFLCDILDSVTMKWAYVLWSASPISPELQIVLNPTTVLGTCDEQPFTYLCVIYCLKMACVRYMYTGIINVHVRYLHEKWFYKKHKKI